MIAATSIRGSGGTSCAYCVNTTPPCRPCCVSRPTCPRLRSSNGTCVCVCVFSEGVVWRCGVRWIGEPVKAIVVPTSIFQTNAKGYPVRSRHAAAAAVLALTRVCVGVDQGASTLHRSALAPAQSTADTERHRQGQQPQSAWLPRSVAMTTPLHTCLLITHCNRVYAPHFVACSRHAAIATRAVWSAVRHRCCCESTLNNVFCVCLL